MPKKDPFTQSTFLIFDLFLIRPKAVNTSKKKKNQVDLTT